MAGKKLTRIIVALLVVQFLLGVLASMYQEVPHDRPWEVFHQFNYILVHAVNGTVLLVLGGVFLRRALRAKQFVRDAAGGFVAMTVAWLCGEVFIMTQNDIWAFLMAGAFIGALMNYAKIMYSGELK